VPLSLLALPPLPVGVAEAAPLALRFHLAFFCLAAAIHGPKTLIGIAIREVVPAEAAGMASGVVGVVGQLGSTLAGSGIAYSLQLFGWESFPSILWWVSCATLLLYGVSYWRCSRGPTSPLHSKKVS
jgi:sugar phosphate permease